VANTAEAEEDAQLLALDGPPDSEEDVVEKLEIMREWFKPMKLEPLAVALSGRYAWRAKLSNGMVVEFGREQNDEDRTAMEARVKRFVASWPQVTEQMGKQIEYADLRYPNGRDPGGQRALPDRCAGSGGGQGGDQGASGAATPGGFGRQHQQQSDATQE
jgi:cell division protein FtsQ